MQEPEIIKPYKNVGDIRKALKPLIENIFVEQNKNVDNIKETLKPLIDNMANKDSIKAVKGDLDTVAKAIYVLGKSIESNKPLDKVYADIDFTSVEKSIESLKQATINNSASMADLKKSELKVEGLESLRMVMAKALQGITKFGTNKADPTDYMNVRLTDGKDFYNAISRSIASGMEGYTAPFVGTDGITPTRPTVSGGALNVNATIPAPSPTASGVQNWVSVPFPNVQSVFVTNQTSGSSGGGDTTQTGSITGSGQSVTFAVNAQSTVGIQASGTFSGTILIKGSVDGFTYTPTTATNLTSGALVTTITTAFTGQVNVAGFVSFQLTSVSWTSGTANISLRASTAISNVMLDNSLPAGTNTIGAVTQSTASNFKNQPSGGDLTSGSQKSQIVDGSGSVIASTSNALNTYLINNTQYTESNTTFPALGNVALGRYTSSPLTLTNGQLLGLQLDVNGNLKTTSGGTVSVTGSVTVTNQNTQYTESTTVAPNTGIGTLGMAKYVAAGLGTLTNNKVYSLTLDTNGFLNVGGNYIAQMSGDLGNLNSTTNSNNTTANTYGTMQAGLDTATGNAQFINVDATGKLNVNVVPSATPNPTHSTLNYGQIVLGLTSTVFVGSSTPVFTHVIVKPLSTNVASVFIGDTLVNITTGIELAPFNTLTTPNGATDQIKIPINDVNLLFGISTNGTDGISWLAV